MKQIERTSCIALPQPLKQAFAFKGGALTELWHTVAGITCDDHTKGCGIGVQSVLWSAPQIFYTLGQARANECMFELTRQALRLLENKPLCAPPQMLAELQAPLTKQAALLCGTQQVPLTFVLNSLVGVDFALWQLWHYHTGSGFYDWFCQFAAMRPEHQKWLANIPLITYETSMDEVRQLLEDGAFFLKIKIGSNPGGHATFRQMMEWDVARVQQIHQLAEEFSTPYTDTGMPLYYLDANGRYPTKALLCEFLQQLDKLHILDSVLLLEEPFAENNLQPVHDLPVLVAGDESAHSAADVRRLAEQYGYRAIALKPIAKTLSQTFQMLQQAEQLELATFCADLTVPPVMLDWNMQVAARLPSLPRLSIGVVESNGKQNYPHWQQLDRLCNLPNASWRQARAGVFETAELYHDRHLLVPPEQYLSRLKGLEYER